MIAPTHLTIDLDFWTLQGDEDPAEGIKIMDRLKQLKVPTHVIRYHHHAIPYIDDGIKRLVNIDTHDDYPREISPGRVAEGNWASPQFLPYVREYLWITHYESVSCAMAPYGWDTNICKFAKFRTVRPKSVIRSIPWPDLESATICLSPNWVDFVPVYLTLSRHAQELFGRPARHGEACPRDRRVRGDLRMRADSTITEENP